MKVLVGVSLIVLFLATLAPSASTEMPRVESKSQEESKEVLIPWEAYHGIGSPQTIEEVADMLYEAYHQSPHFQTDKSIPWETEEEEVERPLDLLIYTWTKEFCILNDWPIQECGPLIDKKLHELIINRT